jgi:SAM-dependent methyltransferase
LPAARAVVERGALRPGERVLDVGCGTGNAALLAADGGARVTAIDPAERLLAVARTAAASRGLEVAFVRGEAGALPCADATADAVLSVFGVIFAPDASSVAAEMARVAAPHGRLVFSAWIPGGPIADVMKVRRDAMAAATGAAGAPPFPWYDRDALARLLNPYGFAISVHEYGLAFTASSPLEFVQSDLRDHPLWIACRAVLEPRGEWQSVWQRTLDTMVAANEDPSKFRVTSRYVVAIARRS